MASPLLQGQSSALAVEKASRNTAASAKNTFIMVRCAAEAASFEIWTVSYHSMVLPES